MAATLPDGVTVELHKRETAATGYWGHPGICTITFCKGSPATAFAALKTRLKAVVAANLWIAGQFVNKKLVYPKEAYLEVLDEILVKTKKPISRSMEYKALVKATGGDAMLSVQSGGKVQKTGARVTRMCVVELEGSKDGEFALVFSMSHVAADGHNYYKIYNMLAGNAPVESMTPARVHEYETREPEWTGKKDFAWLSGGGLIKGMLMGMLFGPKSSWCCYYVDESRVADEKAKASSGLQEVPYVSTNDILTSHFCKAAKARVGMMVVNFRNKISLELTDSHAGCYEGCLLLDPTNYETPQAVRKCLLGGVPYTRRTPSKKLPSLFGESCPMALITSWASFPFELTLEGVDQQILHLPCMAMPDMMDVCIAFKPQPGRLGMLYLAKRAKPKALTDPKTTVLGQAVDSTIFPDSYVPMAPKTSGEIVRP